MNASQWLLLTFIVVAGFGSLQRFTPEVPWNDLTIFFRKNKPAYLRFANQYVGRGLWCLVPVFLIQFLLVTLKVLPNRPWVYVIFGVIALTVIYIAKEISWQKIKK